MRATVMYKAGDVRIEKVPDPKLIEPTDAIISVTRACICGSDLWPYKNMEHSDVGRVMGHEAIGIVADVGRDVRTIKRGDLVIMPFAFFGWLVSVLSRRTADFVRARWLLRLNRSSRSTSRSGAHSAGRWHSVPSGCR